MDYARYNYIAQPGDKDVRFIRQMGPYTITILVNWGNVWSRMQLANLKLRCTLTKWILDKAGDKMYKYGKQSVVLIRLHKQKM
jgi:hypothetical protein